MGTQRDKIHLQTTLKLMKIKTLYLVGIELFSQADPQLLNELFIQKES